MDKSKKPNADPGATVKVKVDDRLKLLLDDGARKKHRSVFLVVGDRAKDAIINLHAMASRANHTARLNILWCMKSDPLFGSTSKSKMRRQGALEVKGGMATENTKELFESFLSQTDIRYCHYNDTHRVLGQTFGMLVLQDFEALTPNILARTIETVQGGGVVLVLVRAMSSLKQLYTLAMDVHARYRSERHGTVVPRFNERFLLSLCDCENMLAIDDELVVLPITANIRHMAQRKKEAMESQSERLRLEGRAQHELDLTDLKGKLKAHPTVGPLVGRAQTVDQARTVLALMHVIAEKSLDATCTVTAGRGRGKSAALGLALAGAIQEGYSTIFVTAPTPENLATLFEFVVKGLMELGYTERTDFDVLISANPDYHKCVVGIQVHREHRQTIQFVAATDSERFNHAEIVVIDEAAALPLPLVRRMIGPWLVFMASTVAGYEGTGRSLSLKLISEMRRRANGTGTNADAADAAVTAAGATTKASATVRRLKELKMTEPVRYGPSDPVEAWLTKLLCLDATETNVAPKTLPVPSRCQLYYVNRDALFSYHASAERMLSKVMSLLVAAHYKNQPNDLQLLSDAPGHHIFVLLDPAAVAAQAAESGAESGITDADILCVIHACEEGNVAADTLAASLDHGSRPSGDLIPYTVAQHYLEKGFASLNGLRVVRIATNPDVQRAGYGSRALQLFVDYYRGSGVGITAEAATTAAASSTASATPAAATEGIMSANGTVAPRKALPALMSPLTTRAPQEAAEYIGVSYGLTPDLQRFWSSQGFEALYVRQVPNELTGEHSCIMVRSLVDGLDFATLRAEFRRRFVALMPMSYRSMPVELASSLVQDGRVTDPVRLDAAVERGTSPSDVTRVAGVAQADWPAVSALFTDSDLERLQVFSASFADAAVILDLIPQLARIYFSGRLFRTPDGARGVELPAAQAAVLLALGLQCRHFDDMATASGVFLGVPVAQLRAFFLQAVTSLVKHFGALKLAHVKAAKAARASGAAPVAAAASSDAASVAVADEGDDDDEEKEEVEEPIIDKATGKVTGMTVVRRVKRVVDQNEGLFREAGMDAVFGSKQKGQQSAKNQAPARRRRN